MHGDTHPRRECQAARHTVHLAEAALDTLVRTFHLFDGLLRRRELGIHQVVTTVRHTLEVVVEHGQRLQTLDEAVGIVVEDHTLVQQSLGVENLFQFLHRLVGFVAPLVLHEGGHVPSGAVFGLQRTVVALHHELRHVAHHIGIALHLVLVLETLVQDEVVVAFEGVTVDAGVVVAVVGDELLQLHRGLRQTLYGEGDILDET